MEKHGLINTQRPSCEALFLYWDSKLKSWIQSGIYSASLSAVTSHRLRTVSQDSCNTVCVYFRKLRSNKANPFGIYGVASSAEKEFSPFSVAFRCQGGPSSSVGIGTGYGLDGPGIEFRWRRDFPPLQTGPGAHPASCTMDTGSFPGVKCGRGVLLTTHPLLVPRCWKGRAIPLLPYGPQPGL